MYSLLYHVKGMFIYTSYHCKKCFSIFYCDKTCSKNNLTKHEPTCQQAVKIIPNIFYPL